MSLRARLILLVSALGAAVVALTLAFVNGRLTRYFTNAARNDLRNAQDALQQSLADSLNGYDVEARIIADATVLKEALVQRSAELAYAYADSARDTTSTVYLTILDSDGTVLADAKNELARGAKPPFHVPEGASTGSRTGFSKIGDSLVANAVAPVMLGGRVIGYVMLGDPVTASRIEAARRAARSDITLLDPTGRCIVSTLPDEIDKGVLADLAKRGPNVDGTEAVDLRGAPHLVATGPLIGTQGEALGFIVVSRSLVEQLQTMRSLQRWLLGLGIAVTAIAVALASALSYRIVSPLRKLTEAAQRIARGDTRDSNPPVSAVVPDKSNDELGQLSQAFGVMASAVAFRQDRLQKEMLLAQTIQTAILPRTFEVPGLDVSADMLPATEVGGDYYDVLSTSDGCWIGIGDVAGHGLNAGLTMLMIQSMVAALTRRDENASPREIVSTLNDALFDNVRHRLQKDDHATFTLLRYHRDGRLVFAGAHEEILIYRAATSSVECVPTIGPWIGARPDIHEYTHDTMINLCKNDVILLYTDGATQARDSSGEMLGLDRLRDELSRTNGESASDIRRRLTDLVQRWTPQSDDDITVLVAKYVG
jgi:phosphoserine phosphatase RsbU/P